MVLLAFALQSYITQTHVHPSPAAAGPAAMATAAISAHDPAPDSHEAIACPFCQAIAAAGGFVTPTLVAVAFLGQAQAAALPQFETRPPALAAPGFSWRSRAPPQS